jgi:glycyl-tRNA synthetase beta chain
MKKLKPGGELLLEVLSDEIPARMQSAAAVDLTRLVTARLAAANLAFESAESHVTPRRLTLVIAGLATSQQPRLEERKGPRVDAPAPAIDGFLRKLGLKSLKDCERRVTDKGDFWFAVIAHKGFPTANVLLDLLPAALAELPWPKSMRWGAHDLRWVRPIHSILCLFNGKAVSFRFGHLKAGDKTQGHRFLAGKPFTVRNSADYSKKLEKAFVILSAERRRELILKGVAALAKREGMALVEDPGLLAEVAGLVEWPVAMLGKIEDRFMALPPEVLTTVMRTHQRYFALKDKSGKIAPRFVAVANMKATDGGKQIVDGNERVLRARLADAEFFWNQDRKATLASRVPALKHIVFHAKLGTVAEKVERVRQLAPEIGNKIGADMKQCERAALLAKADLGSAMVGEFPELQGVMGRYYALHDGEPKAVADAIAEHYSPQGPNDRCPKALVSVAVALADKIDTLVGFFAIGEKPTGSKDPFALRRAALGVIRLILENKLRLKLKEVFSQTYVRYFSGIATVQGLKTEALARELLTFLDDRLKVHLREQGVRHDLISAVFALGSEDDLVRLLARVAALKGFLDTDDGANLLLAYRRAANIVRIEEKRDGASFDGAPDPALLQLPEESALYKALGQAQERASDALSHEEFALAASALAGLRRPVDEFFDKVTVNADDSRLRVNRLRMLARVRNELDKLADFSKIEG